MSRQFRRGVWAGDTDCAAIGIKMVFNKAMRLDAVTKEEYK